MEENGHESSLNYLSSCKQHFLMKDKRCHAQLFVSLYFFYSNTITIRPLLVAEAILKYSSLKNHEQLAVLAAQ
jgi:hypothetical protein